MLILCDDMVELHRKTCATRLEMQALLVYAFFVNIWCLDFGSPLFVSNTAKTMCIHLVFYMTPGRIST